MSKALLVILDGYGISEDPTVSAIDQAHKPFLDQLFSSHPKSWLRADGEAVGLPEGQFGNSEVGHLNIGAGRIVWQELSRIDKSIREESFFSDPTLLKAIEAARKSGRIHLMGLFSDGGVHSHCNHLYALLELCKRNGLNEVYVHAYTDGRDTNPDSGIRYLQEFESKAAEIGVGKIVSIVGRYYAMDRDNRWERVEKAYRLLTLGTGTHNDTAKSVFKESYATTITDEFIDPHTVGPNPDQTRIRQNDTVLFFNFRGDRAREITRALTDTEFDAFEREYLNLNYFSFTQYDATFDHVEVVFKPVPMTNTLGEVVSKSGKKQLRIAETEKYPHVTYFFNGGEEVPNVGEDRIMVASPKVATYDLQPEMSAMEVTDKLCKAMDSGQYELIILNYANPDMVGHTGIMKAAIAAIETIDTCMERTVTTALENGYSVVVIADHGNADIMIQPDGSPHTAHTLAKVPVVIVSNNPIPTPQPGILADVAPTLLKIMGIPQPIEMTGNPLI
jgi:2,3-bisphosphoglycerate-independent phosphoglycerate mutase